MVKLAMTVDAGGYIGRPRRKINIAIADIAPSSVHSRAGGNPEQPQ
jgi:hypothetical protein